MPYVPVAATMILGLLISAPLAGFALLRSYEDFSKGAAKKSSVRVWSAFFGFAFIWIILTSGIARFVVKTSERSFLDELLIICVVFPAIAAFTGLGLMKAYESFQNSLRLKSRVRIWFSFLFVATIFILTTWAAIQLVAA